MSIETEASTDLAYLKGQIAKLEAEAKSIWTHTETYAYLVGVFVLGLILGHLV